MLDNSMPTTSDTSALEGLRVVEIGDGIAVGNTGMILADFGADVVKVEPRGGARDRERAGFVARARGKRSIELDAADESDVATAAHLVARADICIVDEVANDVWSAPGVRTAARDNRRLIVVRMPVYLDGATPWAGGRESERLLSALLGQARRQSSWDGGPVDSVSPFMLYIHGIWTAVCTLAAVHERSVSGFGQTVTVTGANAVMEATVSNLAVLSEAPDPPTNLGPFGRHPTYRHFQCANGEWLSAGALGAKFERAALEILGLEHVINDPRIDGLTSRIYLPENLNWVWEAVDRSAAMWNRDELVAAMLARGVPAGPMREQGECLDDEQVRGIGMRVELKDDDGRTQVMPGVPVSLTRTPGRVLSPAPQLGQHAPEVPSQWTERAARAVGRPPLRNGPLAGVRVLNLGTFVATPYAGMLLAELGAEVIKVEPLTGDPFRENAYAVNRGMRSLAIDLKHPNGRELMHKLVAASDIVLDGMRPGVMRQLGLDYETLKSINPEIITLSLSANGEGGPRSAEPGVDMVIQAVSGMMKSQGGAAEPVANTIAINDVTAAAMSALASVLALVERSRSGQGQRTWDSLLGTAVYLQLDNLVEYDERPPRISGGRDFLGPTPLNRYYEVADGWIAVDVPSDVDGESLLKAGGLPSVTKGPALLAAALGALSGADAVDRLNSAGIPAAQARQVGDVIRDPQLVTSEFVHARVSEEGATFVVPGRLASFSRTQRFGQLHPPGVGEHTEAILRSAGLDAEEVRSAVEDGVIATGKPMPARLAPAYR